MPIDKVLNWVPRLGDVRLLTLNLWQRYGARADRRSVLIEGIRALEPDLLAFHESIKTDEYEKVTDLVGPGFNVVLSKGRHPSGMGISIASRWPLGMVMKNGRSGAQIRQYGAPWLGPLTLEQSR